MARNGRTRNSIFCALSVYYVRLWRIYNVLVHVVARQNKGLARNGRTRNSIFCALSVYYVRLWRIYNVLVHVVARQNKVLTSLPPPPPPPILVEVRIRDRYLALDFSNSALWFFHSTVYPASWPCTKSIYSRWAFLSQMSNSTPRSRNGFGNSPPLPLLIVYLGRKLTFSCYTSFRTDLLIFPTWE